MNLKKRCKVVLVPTNKQVQRDELFTNDKGKIDELSIVPTYIYSGYNLIINSEDSLIDGDFVYLKTNGTITRLVNLNHNSPKLRTLTLEGPCDEKDIVKIIASSNPGNLLSIAGYSDEDDFLSKKNPWELIPPKLSKQFIRDFISEFNKGNIISEVNVEYEEDYYSFNDKAICTLQKITRQVKELSPLQSYTYIEIFTGYGFKGELICREERIENLTITYRPKVENGEIIVSRAKESWNKEEVREKLYSLLNYLNVVDTPELRLTKWIEENL